MGPITKETKNIIAAAVVIGAAGGSCALFSSLRGPNVSPVFPNDLTTRLKGHVRMTDPNILPFNKKDWTIFNHSLEGDVAHDGSKYNRTFNYEKSLEVDSYARQALQFIFERGYVGATSVYHSHIKAERFAINLANKSYAKALEAVVDPQQAKYPLQLTPSCVENSIKDIVTGSKKYTQEDWKLLNQHLNNLLETLEAQSPEGHPLMRGLYPTEEYYPPKKLSGPELAAHLTTLIITQALYNHPSPTSTEATTESYHLGEKAFYDAEEAVNKHKH